MMEQPEADFLQKERRWVNFKSKLEEMLAKNSFQQSRMPQSLNWQAWRGFEDFSRECPLTAKEELEKDCRIHPPLGSNHTHSLNRYRRFSSTSGTSGRAMTWMDTQEDWQWMLGNWDRVLKEAGATDASICFFAFSFGPFLGFWTAYEAAIQRGCVCIPGGGQSTEARLRAILDHQVEYLFCTPTYAMRLIDTAKRKKVSLRENSLEKIIVAGECGGSIAEIRQAMDQTWGGESLLFDHYGMTEVGPVAYETPGGEGGLRIMLESYHAEVIDLHTLRPVGDNELGELVLTPLGRWGSPVLRYRTGDLVRARRGVDGHGLPTFDLVGGILGRADDLVVARGVNLYPSAVDSIVRKFSEVSEYQVMVGKERGMIEVKMRAECTMEVAERLQSALQEAFSLRIPVETAHHESLPRYEMKASRWVFLD